MWRLVERELSAQTIAAAAANARVDEAVVVSVWAAVLAVAPTHSLDTGEKVFAMGPQFFDVAMRAVDAYERSDRLPDQMAHAKGLIAESLLPLVTKD